MSVINTIKSRISNPLHSKEVVEKELIKILLDVGVCTPVHYNSEPWRYLVLQGSARDKFGDFLAARAAQLMDKDQPLITQKLNRIKNKPLRAPVIIVAGAVRSDNPKVLMKENIASVHAGCQNILLTAHELGLAAMWRTGSITYAEDVVEYLKFDQGTQLVGFIYIGHPARELKEKPRKDSTEFSRWLD